MMRRIGRIEILTLAASIAPLACRETGSVAVDTVRRDSSGVEIVENPGPVWTEEAAWRLAGEPRLRIGTFEGAPEQQLYQVTGALLLDDGWVAVANSGSQELRFYGPDGRHVVSHPVTAAAPLCWSPKTGRSWRVSPRVSLAARRRAPVATG